MARWKGYKLKATNCFYCKRTVQELKSQGVYMTVDHVLPKSKGGSNDETNLVTACERCNNMKSDMLGWYEGCVAEEAFGNPEWFRDILLAEEEARKPQLGMRKNGKQHLERDSGTTEDQWWKSLGGTWNN